FGDELYVLAQAAGDARPVRLDAAALPADAVSLAQVETLAARLDAPVRKIEVLDREDGYYYGHKRNVELPVSRLLAEDAAETRLCGTPTTASVGAVGATRRWSGWIRTGLQDLDFPVLRIPGVWHVLVGLLLLGVTAVCATGSWMALKRVRRDLRTLRV